MKIKKIDLINTFAQSVGLEIATGLISDKIHAAALKNKDDYTGEEIARICGELVKEGSLVRIVAQSFMVQSRRKEAEEQTLLLDNIETQIWYLTDFETCGAVNKARADFFGIDKKDFDGKKLYDIINKKIADVCITGNREVFEKKEQIRTEQSVTNSKGEMCILSIIKTPKLSENGDVEYVICTAEDITEQKQVEERLLKMAATLKNQRDELEIKSHELEAASRTKSEFLANMSHELRTPLNSIIGFSEILHDGTFGPLNEKQTKYTSNVLTSGKHLLELINGILDLAKVEAGKMELVCVNLNVSEVFDESIMLLSSVALKKNIVLSTAVDKKLTTIHADVAKFKQILYNLMSNAIKFTPKGGSVTVEAHRSGDMAHIAVSDTGIGISKEEQDKLFQPFMQVDASASRQYEGTGLGLSLVKRFVEMHGGRVWVKSEPGRGSTFSFTIPVIKDQQIVSYMEPTQEKEVGYE